MYIYWLIAYFCSYLIITNLVYIYLYPFILIKIDEEGNLSIWSGCKQYLDTLNNNSSFPINIDEGGEKDNENVSENIIKDDKNSMKDLYNLFGDTEAEEDLTIKESPTLNNGIYIYIYINMNTSN